VKKPKDQVAPLQIAGQARSDRTADLRSQVTSEDKLWWRERFDEQAEELRQRDWEYVTAQPQRELPK